MGVRRVPTLTFVMVGPDPTIHAGTGVVLAPLAWLKRSGMDPRVKPEDDEAGTKFTEHSAPAAFHGAGSCSAESDNPARRP